MVHSRFLSCLLLAMGLSACSTMSLPEIDLMGQSEFDEDIVELDSSFPTADETPDIPDDVRTARQWDQDARDLIALGEELEDVPQSEPALSSDEFERAFNAAQQRADAYKADDPQ